MNRPTFFPPFVPDRSPDDPYVYSRAVRIGNRIETSGQGGWNDDHTFPVALADEIARAFANLGRVLAEVEAAWDDVFAVESWHLPLDEATYGLMVAELRDRMPRHRPIWTALAVPSFGLPGMRLEVRVTAIVTSDQMGLNGE